MFEITNQTSSLTELFLAKGFSVSVHENSFHIFPFRETDPDLIVDFMNELKLDWSYCSDIKGDIIHPPTNTISRGYLNQKARELEESML